VAYDAATQAQVPALIIRVTGDHDAAISAPSLLDLPPGDAHELSVWVANLGRDTWGRKGGPTPTDATGRKDGAKVTSTTHARVVGTWVALGAGDVTVEAAAAAASVTPFDLPVAMAPRSAVAATLGLFAPSAPGDYLLVLDILTPEAGSLTALGVPPTIIRVHVAEPASGAPADTAPTAPAPAETPAS
jgi:hypothetical protein